MPNPSNPPERSAEENALALLRSGSNPFARQVATIGTAEASVLADVPDFAKHQLSLLLEIIAAHRAGKPETKVYPLLGDHGSGKTHLLNTLRLHLRDQAAERGEETLFVVVERLSPGMDAIDYLLWQIVNFLLAQKGEGGRMFEVIAGRLTGRLLAESLRLLSPGQRAELIPIQGFWQRLRLRRNASKQLAAIDELIQRCDAKHPTVESIRQACATAGVHPNVALKEIEKHLDRTESRDIIGWFRKELYARLARFALLNDRIPFEEFHIGNYADAPPNIRNAGNLSRRLLDTWLELLAVLAIPVVVVFDQLEDYLRHPKPEQQKMNHKFVTGAFAQFINELRGVCVLVFAEETLWTELMLQTDAFTRERIIQPIALPGRPTIERIYMPERISPEQITQLIRRRLLQEFPNLDLTGLSPHFPFKAEHLKEFQSEPSMRLCLQQLAKKYNEIIFPAKQSPLDFRSRLAECWKEKFKLASTEIGDVMSLRVAYIPEIQNALAGWLQALADVGQTGSGPWHRVELVTEPQFGQYGYLNVIRTDGPDSPGVGIAVWLGQSRARPYDLQRRIEFFDLNPCPIKTLILLRADGEAALCDATQNIYQKALEKQRDIRVVAYEPRHLYALMAFSPWHQVATAEKKDYTDGEEVYREFLAQLSAELLRWIDAWRQPVQPAEARA
jgi:hypothetical protein